MKRAVVLKHVLHEGPGRLGPLLARSGYELELVELHVQAQHGNVHRHDTGKQPRDETDPDDAACDVPFPANGARRRP